MTSTLKIEIPISKKKLIKGLIISVVFVCIGSWILVAQPSVDDGILNDAFVKYGAACASVLIFGFGIFYFSKKLTDKKPGFTIDENGILDNSSAAAAGHVPWTDMTHLSLVKLFRQQFIVIGIKNPEYYISRQSNYLLKKGMASNYKRYGSPICISANGLACNTDELLSILDKKLSESKRK